MSSILTPIFIVAALALAAIIIGVNRKITSLTAIGGVVLVFGGIFVAMALPQRLRLEKSFAKLDLLLKNYDASYEEFQSMNQRRPAPTFKAKKEFVESQLIAPLDEGLEEISLRATSGVLKQTYASRSALFNLHRAGCEFLLLNFSLATEVEELDAKFRSRSLGGTFVSNAIASSVLPDLKAGMDKLKAALPTEGLSDSSKTKISEQTKAFEEEWSRALSTEMIALETQSAHASLLADLHRFFQLRNQSSDPTHREAGAYLSLDFANHMHQANERWKTMREFLKSADKKQLFALQHEVSNYRSIHDLLSSEDREIQISASFEALSEGWLKKHWSQSQAVAFAEREFHSILPDKNSRGDDQGARNVAAFEPNPSLNPTNLGPALAKANLPSDESTSGTNAHNEKNAQKTTENHGEKNSERFGHDLRVKIRTLKIARTHIVERIMKGIKNHDQDLNAEFGEWALVSRSPLKSSMMKAMTTLEQAANAAAAN